MNPDTTTDPTPPPPVPDPVPPPRPPRLKQNNTMYVTLGGVGPHVQVKMSKKFLGAQVSISFTYVFELYFEYFVKAFGGFVGIKKAFETDDEVYNLVYRPQFRKYYKNTAGGWAGALTSDKFKQLYCHLSWVLSTDVREWEVQQIIRPGNFGISKDKFDKTQI